MFILVVSLIAMLASLSQVACKNFTFSDSNLTQNEYPVDINDQQVEFIVYQLTKQMNQDPTRRYQHMNRIDEARIQVKEGLVWHLRALMSLTNCSVSQLNLNVSSRENLGELCLPNDSDSSYFCNFVARSPPGKIKFNMVTFECVL